MSCLLIGQFLDTKQTHFSLFFQSDGFLHIGSRSINSFLFVQSVMVTEITTKTKLGKTGEGGGRNTHEKPKQKAYRSKNQKRNRKPSSEQNCHFSFGDIVSWANDQNVTLMCYMSPYMAVSSKLKEWTELTCEKDKLYNVFQ